MIQHRGPISGVAAGPGSHVATAGYDNRVILWHGREAVSVGSHDHLANQCSFSPCGTMLVSAGSDYTARLWSLPELRLRAVFDGHDDDVEAAEFDPAGLRVATASRDCGVRVFALDGRLLLRMSGHDADVLSVSWCDDGRALVSSGDDGTVRRWCASTGALLGTFGLDGVETDTVVVGPKGSLLAGNDRGEIVVLGSSATRRVQGHDAGVKRLALDRNGGRLLSASYDRTMCVWQLAGGNLQLERRVALPPIVWARSAAFDDRGGVVMGTFGSSFARYCPSEDQWDLEGVADTAVINAVLQFDGSVYTVGDAGRVARDGMVVSALGSLCNFLCSWQGRLVTGGHLGVMFDARTGERLVEHDRPLNCATALPNGELVVGTYTGEGLVLRVRSGAVEIARVLQLHAQAVKGLAYGGGALFSVSAAGDATRYELDTGTSQTFAGAHDRIANGATALPDGRFATVSRDRSLRLWSGANAVCYPTPHDHSVKCVASSRDGRWIATGSYDGSLAVFDVEAGAFVARLRPTTAGISCVTPGTGPDDFLAAAYEGTVHNFTRRGLRRDVNRHPNGTPTPLA